MPMRVYEARHQNSAAAIDDASVGGEWSFGRLDRLDRFALDDNPQALDERVGFAVEQSRIRESDARHRRREVRMGVLPEPAPNAPNMPPMAAADEWRENFCVRCVFSRAKAGVWQRHPARRGASSSSGAHANKHFPLLPPRRPTWEVKKGSAASSQTRNPPVIHADVAMPTAVLRSVDNSLKFAGPWYTTLTRSSTV
jgi:hypothetical protein